MVCSVVMGASAVDVEGSSDVSGASDGASSVETSADCVGGDCTSAMVCSLATVRETGW